MMMTTTTSALVCWNQHEPPDCQRHLATRTVTTATGARRPNNCLLLSRRTRSRPGVGPKNTPAASWPAPRPQSRRLGSRTSLPSQPSVPSTGEQEPRMQPQAMPTTTEPLKLLSSPFSSTESSSTGLANDSWLQRWEPYAQLARLDKPIGTWLLFWPCAWGVAVGGSAAASSSTTLTSLPSAAADSATAAAAAATVAAATSLAALSDAPAASSSSLMSLGLLLAQFGMGSILLRGAGCTINDVWDQDIDRNVARTSSRPLASGDVTTLQALQFLVVQLALGACVLVSMPHLMYTAQWAMASLPLVAVYPTTKRYFLVPQLVLGLAMNWGAWVGYASMRGCMDYSVVLPLYVSGVTWTLLYDTIYAHQDKEDDAKLGLHSSALAFGSDTKRQTAILTGLATLTYGQWLYVVVLGDPTLNLSDQSDAFWLSSVGGMSLAYAHLLWQVHTLDYASPKSCLERFQSNKYTGGMVFGSLLATKLTSSASGSVGTLSAVVSAASAV